MHKHVHGQSFKKRAPTAVKAIVSFAQKAMGTTDVRIDPKLNQALWAQGIKSVPHRVRIKLERESLLSSPAHACARYKNQKGWRTWYTEGRENRRRAHVRLNIGILIFFFSFIGKRNDEENAKEKLFTYASHVFVPRGGFKVRLLFFLFIPRPVMPDIHISTIRACKQPLWTPSKRLACSVPCRVFLSCLAFITSMVFLPCTSHTPPCMYAILNSSHYVSDTKKNSNGCGSSNMLLGRNAAFSVLHSTYLPELSYQHNIRDCSLSLCMHACS